MLILHFRVNCKRLTTTTLCFKKNKFSIVYMCQKLCKLADSRQSYSKNKKGARFSETQCNYLCQHTTSLDTYDVTSLWMVLSQLCVASRGQGIYLGPGVY